MVQVTLSTPNIKAPDTEISDDELLETLKSVVDDRTDMTRKVQDLNEMVDRANASKGRLLRVRKSSSNS